MNIFDIALMGTSLSAGNAADPATPTLVYGSYITELVKALTPGRASQVRGYNFGIGGALSSGGVSLQLPLVLKVKPRAVLIEFMVNDCSNSGGHTQADSLSNHTTIVNALKALPSPPAIFLVTMNPLIGSSASVTARSNLPTYNGYYASWASSLGVNLLNSSPNWGTLTSADVPDGVHPTLACNVSKLVPQVVSALNGLIP